MGHRHRARAILRAPNTTEVAKRSRPSRLLFGQKSLHQKLTDFVLNDRHFCAPHLPDFDPAARYTGRMRLYVFPSFLPLGAALPWLLTFAGSAAALVFAVVRWLGWSRRRVAWVLFVLGLVVLGFMESRIRGRDALPTLQALETLPPQSTGVGEAWTQFLPRAPLSDLAMSTRHGLVLYGTRQGTLDAIALTDATPRFSVRLQDPVLSRPTLTEAQDRAFVGEGLHESRSSRVTAVRLPDGKPLWSRSFQGHIESALARSADESRLFGCAGEGGVFALDAQSGALLWQNKSAHCDATPLFVNDTIYVLVAQGEHESQLRALDPATGSAQSQVDLPGAFFGTPLWEPSKQMIFVTTGVGSLIRPQGPEKGWAHAIAPKRMRLIWTRKLLGFPLLTAAVIPGALLVTERQGALTALDMGDGKTRWRVSLGSPTLSAARVSPNGQIWSLNDAGLLEIRNSATGQVIKRQPTDTDSTSAPVFTSTHGILGTRATLWGLPL